MRQAIQTKYLCPTNVRGPRYKATAEWGSVTVSADDALDSEGNHRAACLALRQKIAKANAAKYGSLPAHDPWLRPMVCGSLPDGTYAHVFP